MSHPEHPCFLSSEAEPASPSEALFHFIPVPYEKSVSYGAGTAYGPSAILRASQQLEVFDGFSRPLDSGFHTTRQIRIPEDTPSLFERIGEAMEETIALQKIPVLLGGEHTLTLGAARALQSSQNDIGVVQFDAHADLRDHYEGTPYSHACVMRRVSDLGIPIHQIGVRSLSQEDLEVREQSSKITYLDAADWQNGDNLPGLELPPDFPKNLYVTFDVDVLDSSIMPATGTPEPGGLNWCQVHEAFEKIIRGRKVVGMDFVEFAPIPGLHAYDFTIARLIYNFLGIVIRCSQL